MLSAAAVYLIAMKAGFSRSSVILSGVAVSSLMTALINVIVTLRPEVIMDKASFSLGGLQFVDVIIVVRTRYGYPCETQYKSPSKEQIFEFFVHSTKTKLNKVLKT